jgi:hypothetical protein
MYVWFLRSARLYSKSSCMPSQLLLPAVWEDLALYLPSWWGEVVAPGVHFQLLDLQWSQASSLDLQWSQASSHMLGYFWIFFGKDLFGFLACF